MKKVASKPAKVASQPTTYTLHLTAAQAATISKACEVLARLGMGQFRDALECLPVREYCANGWPEDMDAIGHILKKYAPIFGIGAAAGITHRETPETSKVAWDVYQVTRHRLAWDRARAEGHQGDSPPRWSVDYDPPMKTSTEPLAWMAQAGRNKSAPIHPEFVAGFDAAAHAKIDELALIAWAKRHDLQGSVNDLRAIVSDARSLHLTKHELPDYLLEDIQANIEILEGRF